MNSAMDLIEPIDVLMAIRGQIDSDDPDGPGSLVMDQISRVPDFPPPSGMRFESELAQLTFGDMPGSLRGKMPDPLYVFSHGRNPDRPLDFAEFSISKSLYVVSTRVKHVLETLSLQNSEFYPVVMVYSDKEINSEDWGGGPVVADTHWLWWCFAVLDLVDAARTEAVFTPLAEPNRAAAGHPIVEYQHVGPLSRNQLARVVLKRAPYDACPVFKILGWSMVDTIVSPDLVSAFSAASLIDPDGPISIHPLPLDRSRYSKINVEYQYKRISSKPRLRIFGTHMTAADEYDPPFYARRSPLFPLPGGKV